MEQKNGLQQQGVKALLYFAVMSVFIRASLSRPNVFSPQHNIHYETLVGTEPTANLLAANIGLTSKDEETTTVYQVPLTDNADMFSVVIASAAALLNGLS